MKIRWSVFAVVVLIGLLVTWPASPSQSQVRAAPAIFASPIHGGCYIAAPTDCRIHVEPYTINIASGKKLVRFQLVAIQGGTGTQTVIYDFRPDQSNPVPYSGNHVYALTGRPGFRRHVWKIL